MDLPKVVRGYHRTDLRLRSVRVFKIRIRSDGETSLFEKIDFQVSATFFDLSSNPNFISLILNMIADHEAETATFEQQLAYLDAVELDIAPEAVPRGRNDPEPAQ